MPAKQEAHWTERLGWSRPCHYNDGWLDTYADLVRKAALNRVFPGNVRRLVDIGCGDGSLDLWLEQEFDVQVWGVDVFPWPGAQRLERFTVLDAEELLSAEELGAFEPQMTMAVTSLPFMEDWRGVVEQMCGLAPRALVLENLQTPAPPWQKGLPEKEPIELPELIEEFSLWGFTPARCVCVNVLDRRLFLRLPHWLAFAVTLPVDLLLARAAPRRWWRYTAVLFEAQG